MKKYLIESQIDVYKESFKDGEGNHVNYWVTDETIHAETPLKALKEFFENKLYFTFDEKMIHQDLDIYESNQLCYNNLVDESNSEVLEGSIEYANFTKGFIDLYTARSFITIFEIVPAPLLIENQG
jgi:hypothetical protein